MAVDTQYVTRTKWTGMMATELTYPNGRQMTNGYDALNRRNMSNGTIEERASSLWSLSPIEWRWWCRAMGSLVFS